MGLGSFPAVTLKEAREEAEKWRGYVRRGLDPIKERERERRAAERNLHLLNEIARDAFESRKAELKGDGVAGRWFTPLELHILPKLGKVPVADIDQTDIRDTLAPIWHTKAETARKAMNRLGICLKHAAALGLDVDLQATEKARALLGKQRHKAENIPAVPWQEVPMFYRSLTGGTVTELALRLLILTAVRSHPLRHLHLSQIEGDVWTIPAEAMKGRVGATSRFPRAALPRGAGGHRAGPPVRARRLPVFRRPQGRDFRHDHEPAHGAAGDEGAPARLPLLLPRLGGRGDEYAARCGRDGAGPYGRRRGGAVLSADGFP